MPPRKAALVPAEEPTPEPEPEPTPDPAAVFADDVVVRPVIVKLARIMAGIGEIKPEGRNAHFGYNFIKDTQVSGVTRARMAKEHLVMVPEVLEESWFETKTAKGGTSWVTKLKVRFTIIDGDSGDMVSGVVIGYGDDTGDKGANKALTAAQKYFLLKLFQVGGEDDLEQDAQADLRAADRQAGSAADKGVVVTGAKIEGVARGGRSDTITQTQMRQIFALYKDLDLTPEAFVTRIDAYLNDNLQLPDDGDVTAALNGYLRSLSADDAGKLISALVDEKDTLATKLAEADGPRGGVDDVAAEAYG